MRSSSQRSRTRRNYPLRRTGFRTVFCDAPSWSDAVRVCLGWSRRRTLVLRQRREGEQCAVVVTEADAVLLFHRAHLGLVEAGVQLHPGLRGVSPTAEPSEAVGWLW